MRTLMIYSKCVHGYNIMCWPIMFAYVNGIFAGFFKLLRTIFKYLICGSGSRIRAEFCLVSTITIKRNRSTTANSMSQGTD